jgi:hypothetical protein
MRLEPGGRWRFAPKAGFIPHGRYEAMVPAVRTPREAAWAFHETLVEVLRHLNQAAERWPDINGIEFLELERTMSRFWTIEQREGKVDDALRVLLENGLVAEESTPAYAWDRSRVLGDRFRITPQGKAYLIRQIEESNRIR